MSVKSGQSVTVGFCTSSPTTQALTNADSTPTGTLVVNGTDNAATVTVTNVSTGRYKAAVTLPTLAVGDMVEIFIAATVGAVAGGAFIWRDTKDMALATDGGVTLADGVAHGGTPGSSTATLALKSINATNPGGDAIHAESTGGNGSGLACIGSGYGSGFLGYGLGTGSGALFLAADAGAYGVEIDGGGHALYLNAGPNSSGLKIDGKGTQPGILAAGGGSGGPGARLRGWGTAHGVEIWGGSDGGSGVHMEGWAGAPGLDIATFGGGDGIKVTVAEDGHGISVTASGSGKHDVNLAGTGTFHDGVNARDVTTRANVVSVNGTVFSGPGVPSDQVMLSGVLPDQSLGDVDHIVLPAGPASNGVLTGSRLRVTAGAGQYQERAIYSWDGTNKVAGVDQPWNTVLPAAGDTFQVLYDHSYFKDPAGNVLGYSQVFSFDQYALAQFFNSDSGQTYSSAVAGSVVKEIAGKLLATVYDTATVSGSTITLSDGTTQVISAGGRVTTPP